MKMGSAPNLSLPPPLGVGVRNPERRAPYDLAVARWCDGIKSVWRGLDFQIGTREWCYLLEPHGLSKDDFDKAERLLVKCRKAGLLPLDIVIEDDARAASGLEALDDGSPTERASSVVRYVAQAHLGYHPISFWENQDHYVEMATEKASLRSLFESECEPFRVPIFNSKGSWDMNSRAALLRRFAKWQAQG
jgi:hypothetical protein